MNREPVEAQIRVIDSYFLTLFNSHVAAFCTDCKWAKGCHNRELQKSRRKRTKAWI